LQKTERVQGVELGQGKVGKNQIKRRVEAGKILGFGFDPLCERLEPGSPQLVDYQCGVGWPIFEKKHTNWFWHGGVCLILS
jgi:hypothetical protein